MSIRFRQLLNATILAAGLVLCVIALVRLQHEHPLRWSPSAPALIGIVMLALTALTAMAYAWQRYVLAFFRVRLSIRDAAYQSCVMLVAKYVPVMIAGFVARVSANAGRASPSRVVFATLTELVGAVAAASAVGLFCLSSVFVPVAAPLVVVIALAGIWLAPTLVAWTLRIVARFRRLPGTPDEFPAGGDARRALREASILQIAQWIALAGFVACAVSLVAPGLDASTQLTISGAYALAVVSGIAVVFLPGGIGVREAVFVWLASAKLDAATALQLALALRIAMSAFDLLAGAICVVLRATAPAEPDR